MERGKNTGGVMSAATNGYTFGLGHYSARISQTKGKIF